LPSLDANPICTLNASMVVAERVAPSGLATAT
jgi:hypothetical protein